MLIIMAMIIMFIMVIYISFLIHSVLTDGREIVMMVTNTTLPQKNVDRNDNDDGVHRDHVLYKCSYSWMGLLFE